MPSKSYPNAINFGDLPTPSDPLRFSVPGHTPALKNNRRAIVGKDGKPYLVPRRGVKKYVNKAAGLMEKQYHRQRGNQPGSTLPLSGVDIIVYVEVYFYLADETKQVQSDTDNAYTTVQEALMKAGVIEDDRMVSSYYVERRTVRVKDEERALAWVFVADETRAHFEQLIEFRRFGYDPVMESAGVPTWLAEAWEELL